MLSILPVCDWNNAVLRKGHVNMCSHLISLWDEPFCDAGDSEMQQRFPLKQWWDSSAANPKEMLSRKHFNHQRFNWKTSMAGYKHNSLPSYLLQIHMLRLEWESEKLQKLDGSEEQASFHISHFRIDWPAWALGQSSISRTSRHYDPMSITRIALQV